MSCPRPHGKSLIRLGSRQRCHGSWVRVGQFLSLWLQSKRVWIHKKLADYILSSQMWSGLAILPLSLLGKKSMYLYERQRVQNMVRLVSVATDQDCGLSISHWMLTLRGWFLSCHRYFWGAVIYPAR